jgi:hypothetical protein
MYGLNAATGEGPSHWPCSGESGVSFWCRSGVGTRLLVRASRDPDLNPPRRDLGVLLLSHEVELGRTDVAVPGELPHFIADFRGGVTCLIDTQFFPENPANFPVFVGP